ncbi:hypothetical protein ACROYT_G014873 [Oculina patagonica]
MDEMDEFSDESDVEANNDMEDNPPVRHGNGFWGQRDEQTVLDRDEVETNLDTWPVYESVRKKIRITHWTFEDLCKEMFTFQRKL